MRWPMQAHRAVARLLPAELHFDVESLVRHHEPASHAAYLFALLAERRSEAMGCILAWHS